MASPMPTEFAKLAAAMPPTVRRLLVEGVDPAAISVVDLLADLRIDPSRHLLQGGLKAHVMSQKNMLSRETCAVLCAAVDRERDAKIDSVDGAPDHQLRLQPARLKSLVGEAAVRRLFQLPATFRQQADGTGATDMTEQVPHEILVRRYTADTRPWIAFHADSAAVTVNVALSADKEHQGGRLVAVANDTIATITREEGEATIHDARLLHAVNSMKGGVRYSLILFFGNRVIPEHEREEVLFAHWVQTLSTAERQRLSHELEALEAPLTSLLQQHEAQLADARAATEPARLALRAAEERARSAAHARAGAEDQKSRADEALRRAEAELTRVSVHEKACADELDAARLASERCESHLTRTQSMAEKVRAEAVSRRRATRATLRAKMERETAEAERTEAAKRAALGERLQQQAQALASRGISLEHELVDRMAARRPELRALLQSTDPTRVMEALAPHQEEVVTVMDELLNGVNGGSWRPYSDPSDVHQEHMRQLDRFGQGADAFPIKVGADPLPSPTTPPAAYATLMADGRLRPVLLADIRPSASRCEGAVVSGVIASRPYCFRTAPLSSPASGGACAMEGVSTLLRSDGGLVRLRVLGCSGDEAMRLEEGRRVSILHAWMTMWDDGQPTLRVDDAATLHHDVDGPGLIAAIRELVAIHAPTDGLQCSASATSAPSPTPAATVDAVGEDGLWAAGVRVRVHGLKAAAQHNGKLGVLSGRQRDGREHVRLQGGGALLARRANLAIVELKD